MESVRMWLVLIVFVLCVMLFSLVARNEALAFFGTGIGIRKDGPLNAVIGTTIKYSITVYNLGDYWVTNVTVMDRFPNGTSSIWNLSDLAPKGQHGDAFKISGIAFLVTNSSVLSWGNSSVIINHAEVTGFSDVEGLSLLVRAETNYPAFITSPPVGGHSVSIHMSDSSMSTITYVILLSIMTALLSASRHFGEKHR